MQIYTQTHEDSTMFECYPYKVIIVMDIHIQKKYMYVKAVSPTPYIDIVHLFCISVCVCVCVYPYNVFIFFFFRIYAELQEPVTI